MKAWIGLVLLGTAVPLTGCVSAGNGLVVAPVGPVSFQGPVVSASDSSGTLVVFSALDPSPHFTALPYRTIYSDYKILSESGAVLQSVHNDNGTSVEGPKAVRLLPGTYRVVANANGYGPVEVPVVIVGQQTTAVHLDGSSPWSTSAPRADVDVVRLPDGQRVGYRAGPSHTPKVGGSEAGRQGLPRRS